MVEALSEREIVDLTITAVYGYCFAELGSQVAAESAASAIIDTCAQTGNTDKRSLLKKCISLFDDYRDLVPELESPYTRDQKVALSLRFGAGLTNPQVAEIMGKSLQNTWNLTIQAVAIFNASLPKQIKTK